jgi:hypothetical protein
MASGDDYLGAFIDSMGALLVGSHTYAESEQTLAWFGQGLGAGLVTGYFLGIIPVVLGGGVRLFDSPRPPENLRLTDSKVWPNGVAQLRYEVTRS